MKSMSSSSRAQLADVHRHGCLADRELVGGRLDRPEPDHAREGLQLRGGHGRTLRGETAARGRSLRRCADHPDEGVVGRRARRVLVRRRRAPAGSTRSARTHLEPLAVEVGQHVLGGVAAPRRPAVRRCPR